MKILRFSLFICLYALLNACAHHTELSRLGDDASREDRRLLVTFADRSVSQKLPGNVLDDFPIRRQYGNSGWSERVAQDLADRHHILLVAQWPVTTLGVSCVVYEVPEPLQLQQVMAELQSDREVAQVQRMQSFRVLDHKTDSGSGYPFWHL